MAQEMPQLRAYQEISAARLAQWGRGILGHECGLGKTAIMVRTLDNLKVTNALVVTTASSLFNWQREFQRWQLHRRPVTVHTKTARVPEPLPRGVHIISYTHLSLFSPLVEQLQGRSWPAVIFDEAHYLKNPTSTRTKHAYLGPNAFAKNATHVFSLSGTIAPNNYGELWPHLKVMLDDPSPLGTPDQFLRKYHRVIDTAFGPKIVGTQNVTELRKLLKSVYHRRTLRGVRAELPSLTIDTTPIKLSEENLHAARVALQLVGHPDGWANAEAEQISMSTERRQLGLAKVKAAAEYALDLLDCGVEKLIIFAHHREVITHLSGLMAAYKPAVLTGGTSSDERGGVQERFQTDPACRVFIGQMKAAGEAITLTAANRVLIVEPSWVPADNWQCIKRAHRLGQTLPVLAEFLTAAKTMDDVITRTTERKTKALAELFG